MRETRIPINDGTIQIAMRADTVGEEAPGVEIKDDDTTTGSTMRGDLAATIEIEVTGI
jgi:hypothetical protein